MSSTRAAPRTAMNRFPSGHSHQMNGSVSNYDANDTTTAMNFIPNSKTDFDSSSSRSSLPKNVSQYDGIYRNARFIHAISSGLLGQHVLVQTSDRERFHGVLETFSPNGDIALTVSHRLETNNNDPLVPGSISLDLIDTIDSSAQTFELHKRIIKASTIVEIIAADIDLLGSGKCLLEENPKVTQFEDDRFSRMEHFYGADDIDSEALEDLELGDNGETGFDVEDMFQTNKQKFQTVTDYDESKYTNVPVPELSEADRAEIERKAKEIETGKRSEEIDEDDAGVKRPTEYHQSNEGTSQMKQNRPYRSDYGHDSEYNSSIRRGNVREQRGANNTTNRRGSGGNYGKQNQYSSTRSTEQSTYTRQPQHHPRGNRSTRFTENRPTYEGRKSPSQLITDENHRQQRVDSENYSHGQVSGPTSPSTTVSTRTVYASNNRPSANRNSPAPYTGSSSSCNTSMTTTSPPSTNQVSNTNKSNKKSGRNDQQPSNEEPEHARSGRLSNTANANRPSQLQSKQQASTSNSNLAGQEDVTNPQEIPNTTQNDPNASYASRAGAATPNSAKPNPLLNPDAVEFVPGFSRESSSRPESRGAATNSPMTMHSYMNHTHGQAASLQILQQQQAQSPQPGPGMIPTTHPTNQAAYFPQYFPAPFASMPQLINATAQQMGLGMMPTSMLQTQGLIPNQVPTPNTNNGSSSGMTTPNSSVSGGPTYKLNTNTTQPNESGNMSQNSNMTKKTTISVQNVGQSNMPSQQQQQPQGPSQIIYQNPSVRFLSPEYMMQQGAAQSMPIQQVPIYYHMNNPGLIQTGNVGQPSNIMIPATTSTTVGTNPAQSQLFYAYTDPRLFSLYSAATPAGLNTHWQSARSPPQQQQQQQQSQVEQQRVYASGQTAGSQQNSTGVPNANNNNGRPGSVSGSNSAGVNNPPMAAQYTMNGPISTPYAYASAWLPGPQQMPSPQSNLSPQVNMAYNIIYDPSQQSVPSPQAAYVHANPHETAAYYMQAQQSQQASNQQNLDPTAGQGNYPR